MNNLKNSEIVAKDKGCLHDTVADIPVCCEPSHGVCLHCVAKTSLQISQSRENQVEMALGISKSPDYMCVI